MLALDTSPGVPVVSSRSNTRLHHMPTILALPLSTHGVTGHMLGFYLYKGQKLPLKNGAHGKDALMKQRLCEDLALWAITLLRQLENS